MTTSRVILALLALGALGALYLLQRRRHDLHRSTDHTPAVAAANLAVVRILVFSILLINLLWEDLPSLSHLPPELRIDMGVMSWLHRLPGWSSLYTSPGLLWSLKVLTVVALFCAVLGFKTRASVPVATVLALICGGMLREYSHLFHTMVVPLQLGLVLSFFPCGDALSVDHWSTQRFSAEAGRYVAGRRLCWTLVAVTYLCAGLSKLANGGLFWWHGENLKTMVLTNNFSTMQFDWGLQDLFVSLPVPFYGAMGLATLAIEILFPLVLFFRRARLVLPILAALMHLGILFSQGILFFDLILLQAIFYDVLPARFAGRADEPARPVARPRRAFLASPIAAAGLLVSWTVALEHYPMTSWQIYSHHVAGPEVLYWKIRGEQADGREVMIRPDDWIGAVADCRYRDYFFRGRYETATFLRVLGNRANALIEDPSARLVNVALERWSKSIVDGDKPRGDRLVGRLQVSLRPD
jgi:hypothetical protein